MDFPPYEPDADTVIASVVAHGGIITGMELVAGLVERGFDRRLSQRRIQACLDSGKLRLGRSLKLEIPA